MKIMKPVCMLAFAMMCTLAVTGCHGHKPKTTFMPGLQPLAPQDIGPGTTIHNDNQLPPVDTMPTGQDRTTLAAQTIHFVYDSAAVKKTERVHLEAVAQALKADGSAKLLIEGNCDERGTEEYNRALGERRALAARKELIKMGISGSRIITKSFGKDQPADPGHDEAARSQNRRDDFVILRNGAGGGVNGS